MKTKHYFFLSAAMLGLAWGWVYNVSGQTAEAPAMNAPDSPLKESGLANVDLRGALSYSDEWEDTPFPYGFYSAPTSDDASPEFVFLTDDRNMEGGAVYVDGVIHAISKVGQWLWDDEDEDWYFSQSGAAFTSYDAATGEVLYDTTEVTSDLFSSDLCYDKTSGTVYGVFTVEGYKNAWGTLDVDNLEITYIKTYSGGSYTFAAIDVDGAGQAYALTGDGKLVKIDKETGEISEPLAEYNLRKGYKSTGVIDTDTNIFYILLNSFNAPGVYAIDLNSYELTKLSTLRHYERWGGAYIAKEEVEEGTPAAATNLVLSFPEASLEGTLTFDAPTQTADDDDLSGETLRYEVKADDETVAEGAVLAGETVTTDTFTVAPGKHIISVALSNEKGTGLSASTSFWFGSDAPAGVENLSASNDGYTVTLSWDAPAVSVHGGYFNPSDVTYTVTRMPDNVVVAENIKETSVTDVIESKKVAKYSYTVLSSYDGIEGNLVESSGLILGDGVSLPYETEFSDEDCELMSVEDTNGDGNTWDIGDETAIYRFGDVDADDWLFVAPLYLEKGNTYALESRITSGLARKEKFEVKLGKAPQSDAMVSYVVEPVEFESDGYDIAEYFTVPETGTYYMGFHALSPETHFTLWVDFVKIDIAMSEDAPAAATVKATAGEKGAISATLTIQAPMLRYNGKELTELEGANIFHGDILIESLDEVVPGETYTYVHEGCDAGFNTYSVVFVNEYGSGMPVEATVFVGEDTPLAPKNVRVKLEDDIATVTWDSPGERGVNGGYVDPEKVVYTPSYTHYGEWIIMEETSDTELSVEYDMGGDQRWFVFGLIATTDMGTSDVAYSNYMLTGDPYNMPYLESLNNGRNLSVITSVDPFGYVGSYSSDVVMSATETGGCFMFTPLTLLHEPPFVDTLTTGVINTSGYPTVNVSFYYYNDASENDGDMLTVSLYDQDNDITYNLGSVVMDGSATEWRKFEATKEINSDNLRIHICMTSNNGNTIYLDEFSLNAATVGVSGIMGDAVNVTTAEGSIFVSGLSGEHVTIATTGGIVIYNGSASGEVSVAVPTGIYLVRVADKTFKVAL